MMVNVISIDTSATLTLIEFTLKLLQLRLSRVLGG